MDLSQLISFLEEAKTVAARTVVTELSTESSVTITSETPFESQEQVDAVIRSKLFEQILQESASKVMSTGKKTKGTKKKVVIPGTGGDFESILKAHLTATVRKNMGVNGALVNRTGQFLNSVKSVRVISDAKGMLTAFYTYMKYPYATFSKGGKQYSKKRDPNVLISKSIMEIAKEAAIKRLKAVPA